jgi:hypothetical protein
MVQGLVRLYPLYLKASSASVPCTAQEFSQIINCRDITLLFLLGVRQNSLFNRNTRLGMNLLYSLLYNKMQ